MMHPMTPPARVPMPAPIAVPIPGANAVPSAAPTASPEEAPAVGEDLPQLVASCTAPNTPPTMFAIDAAEPSAVAVLPKVEVVAEVVNALPAGRLG